MPRPNGTIRCSAIRPAAGLLTALLLTGCGFELQPGAKSLFSAFAPPTPAQAADMALDPEDPDRRFKGLQLLANAQFGGDDVYLELYLDSLNDPDPGVRWASISALGRHGGPEHVELMLPGLTDDDALVRSATSRALQRIHNPIAIEPLLATLRVEQEPNDAVRAQAAEALGQYATPRVLQGLVAALDDANLAVNRSTLHALETLTGQNFGLDRRGWLDWIREAGANAFAARRPYVFPTFQRDRKLVEYLPLIAPPPNEAPNTPVGMPPVVGG